MRQSMKDAIKDLTEVWVYVGFAVFLIFSLLVLAGCVAYRYSKPGGTTEMVNADLDACKTEIQRSKPPIDLSGGVISRQEIDACLATKGWTRER